MKYSYDIKQIDEMLEKLKFIEKELNELSDKIDKVLFTIEKQENDKASDR